ncbi:MAG: hypothetical protein IPP15_15175 [Saprospiraceae bacterium]|uniref:Outer membrane protein beta-barrel domain-containing protein n=1 Tax=Candidatus Opimibacter skivensis TaxID=2982028 RepID=A0A9D7XR50_9BACT|nr:hypothetical protein [Candidatus Opimibacter skivensis]
MRVLIIISILLISSWLKGQDSKWQISFSLGISSINNLISNKDELDNKFKYNKKINTLNNKFRDNHHNSGLINFAFAPQTGILKTLTINTSLSLYNFGSVYYKEDKCHNCGAGGDTINTPNWLTSKYTFTYVELGLSKEISFLKNHNLEIGIFAAYSINLFYTNKAIIYDSVYGFQEWINPVYAPDLVNNEFYQYNYGLRTSISFFKNKTIHPKVIYTQSLNDIAKRDLNTSKHANIWSLNIGLCTGFKKRENKLNGKAQ